MTRFFPEVLGKMGCPATSHTIWARQTNCIVNLLLKTVLRNAYSRNVMTILYFNRVQARHLLEEHILESSDHWECIKCRSSRTFSFISVVGWNWTNRYQTLVPSDVLWCGFGRRQFEKPEEARCIDGPAVVGGHDTYYLRRSNAPEDGSGYRRCRRAKSPPCPEDR